MKRLHGFRKLGMTGLTAVALMLGAQGAPLAAPLNLSTKPLFLETGVAPNIVVTLDDSGSMALSYVPDSLYLYMSTNRAKSSTFNSMYYDPNVTYKAPLDENGNSLGNADFYNAWNYGYDLANRGSNTVDLSSAFRPTYSNDGTNISYSGSAEPAYYYVFDTSRAGTGTCPNPADTNVDDCYTKVVVSSTSGPGSSDERQNFANWYSYYSTRMMATLAGASRAFAGLGTNIRVGWQSLNSQPAITAVQPFQGTQRQGFYNWLFQLTPGGGTPLRPAMQRAGEYYKTAQPYYNNAVDSTNGSASCRQDYHVLMTDGLWNGYLSNGPGNYDGTSHTLPDGTSYAPQPPYTDTNSNALADLAFKYWAEDLNTSLTDNVPSFMPVQSGTPSVNYWNARNDPATWQHMVDFTVGLGLGSTLTDPAWGGSTFAGDYPLLANGTKSWPTVTSNTQSTVYDLWHAAIDSRGQFFSADNPKALSDAFSNILDRIADRTSSGTSVSLEAGTVASSSQVYIASFNSHGWSGSLVAYQLLSNGDIGSANWDAACVLTGGNCAVNGQSYTGMSAANRRIITYNSTSASGVAFQWSNLDSSEQAALNASDGLGQERLDFLRGDRSEEIANGGSFRDRSSLLGDIVHSSPVYVGPPDRFYPSNWDDLLTAGDDYTAEDQASGTYDDFKSAQSNRAGVVYVGANDGMLHAFSAATGEELFAFVPSVVYPQLASLSDPAYAHNYFVDATPTEGDAFFGGAWHTLLVGGLRGGGQEIYALDITDVPGASLNEANIASKVLWEFTDADDADLGDTYGEPQIVRLHNGDWAAIFGNGYNNTATDAHVSSTGDAVLFIKDLQTGNVYKIDTRQGTAQDPEGSGRPNGLATPTPVDVDGDSIIDFVYAGDLFGNLWKFDLRDSNPSNWKIAYGTTANPSPLFTAVRSGVHQPITTRPSIRRHPTGDGFLVEFGTGKYLENADATASSKVQSVYGVWDKNQYSNNGSAIQTVFDRSDLLQQTITQTVSASGNDYRIVSNNPITWYTQSGTPPANSNAYLGWYLDLLPQGSSPQGEMQVTDTLIRGNRLMFDTLIPNDDPCGQGGDSWFMVLDYRTGGRFSFSPFDVNNDGVFDVNDLIDTTGDGSGDTAANGIKSNGGILQTPALVSLGKEDRAYLGGSGSGNNNSNSNNCQGSACVNLNRDVTLENRQSWRELR